MFQDYLHQLYRRVDAYTVAESYKKNNLSATQGEILSGSINQIIAEIPFQEDDVFYDLGCGLGKIVLQIFLNTPVKEACGIEFVPELHQQSLELEKRLRLDWPQFYQGQRKIRLILGNFLESSLQGATILLINSTCFSQSTLAKVSAVINQYPQIHSLLSLRPLPLLQHLTFVKTLTVECTWDSTLGYLYQKNPLDWR